MRAVLSNPDPGTSRTPRGCVMAECSSLAANYSFLKHRVSDNCNCFRHHVITGLRLASIPDLTTHSIMTPDKANSRSSIPQVSSLLYVKWIQHLPYLHTSILILPFYSRLGLSSCLPPTKILHCRYQGTCYKNPNNEQLQSVRRGHC
jgi:hypothetical protein